MSSARKHIAIIGGGPAGLMAAEILAQAGLAVTIYDRMPTFGRKFLMAGRGGLNLTHSEPLDKFLNRYGEAKPLIEPAIQNYPPAELIAWCENLGQPTFTGTSGRVFPKAFKASPLLRAWLGRLNQLEVTFAPQHTWTGWQDKGELTFSKADGTIVSVKPDATILALGGASWPRLGSDGKWADLLPADVTVSPLRPSNCGLVIPWSDIFRQKFAGHPLKSISLTYGEQTIQGEMMITSTGLEGTPAYTVSGTIRDNLNRGQTATIWIDLRPNVSADDLRNKLGAPRKRQSLSTFLQKALNLPAPAIGLVQEIFHQQKLNDTPETLAKLIKSLPLAVRGVSGLDRAISSAGGISFDSLTLDLMLVSHPGVFAAGEMLDWEAPTGGYLLQGSFSTAVTAANGALKYLK